MPLYSKERFRHELVSYETEMLLGFFCDTNKLTVRPTTLVLHVQRSEVMCLQTLLVYNLHTGKHNKADSG